MDIQQIEETMDRTIEDTNPLFINNSWTVITIDKDTGGGPWW